MIIAIMPPHILEAAVWQYVFEVVDEAFRIWEFTRVSKFVRKWANEAADIARMLLLLYVTYPCHQPQGCNANILINLKGYEIWLVITVSSVFLQERERERERASFSRSAKTSVPTSAFHVQLWSTVLLRPWPLQICQWEFHLHMFHLLSFSSLPFLLLIFIYA